MIMIDLSLNKDIQQFIINCTVKSHYNYLRWIQRLPLLLLFNVSVIWYFFIEAPNDRWIVSLIIFEYYDSCYIDLITGKIAIRGSIESTSADPRNKVMSSRESIAIDAKGEKRAAARNGNKNFLPRGANRTRGFPRCEIRRRPGDKERPRGEMWRGNEEKKKRRREKDDGKRKDGGRRRMWRERARWGRERRGRCGKRGS